MTVKINQFFSFVCIHLCPIAEINLTICHRRPAGHTFQLTLKAHHPAFSAFRTNKNIHHAATESPLSFCILLLRMFPAGTCPAVFSENGVNRKLRCEALRYWSGNQFPALPVHYPSGHSTSSRLPAPDSVLCCKTDTGEHP